MIVVFASFMLEDVRDIKVFGLGLAVAVLLDATLVRLLLVPATMELLGDRNWWLRWKLTGSSPLLDVEGGPAAPEPRPTEEPTEEPSPRLAGEPAVTAMAATGGAPRSAQRSGLGGTLLPWSTASRMWRAWSVMLSASVRGQLRISSQRIRSTVR